MVTPLYEVELVYQPKSLDVLVGKEMVLFSCSHAFILCVRLLCNFACIQAFNNFFYACMFLLLIYF